MPEDLVPYWDMEAPKIPDEPRDVSSAAVIASALYEICTLGVLRRFPMRNMLTILWQALLQSVTQQD